ncbi:MAG: hypothetical protein IT260_11855 [Saprospiraceae bacterium]|nr:hypothetical protein [Saprospiraceae bacterium]
MKKYSTFRGIFLLFGFLALALPVLHAQLNPTLSVQGILKKANGVAVDDGTYPVTFKLYTTETGGSAIWSETQNSVEVSSGIYSATLGADNSNPLNAPFDQLYYLGITVGSAELTPRVLLTSAPYALSLIGQTNKFPSAGTVQAEKIAVAGASLPVTHSVVAVGGYLARGGAPGVNGASNNGYAFNGSNGDKDSGLFSTAEGKVAMYSNNTEVLAVTPGAATVSGTVTTNGINLANNSSMTFNGVGDWRLVEVDYLESSAEGWGYSLDDSDDRGAWKNGIAGTCPVEDFGDFAGKALQPAINDYVIKKQFSPPGSYDYVKIVFKYFIIGNWDPGDLSSNGFAAFANDQFGNGIRVGWQGHSTQMSQTWLYDYDLFRNASSFVAPANQSDHWITGEMIGKRSTPFWVYFGYGNNEGESDEHFAVGGIEVWVK